MTKNWNWLVRRMGPLFAAGFLLQAGGCTLDPGTLASGLVTAIANNLIASFVYGLFNIPMSGFF